MPNAESSHVTKERDVIPEVLLNSFIPSILLADMCSMERAYGMIIQKNEKPFETSEELDDGTILRTGGFSVLAETGQEPLYKCLIGLGKRQNVLSVAVTVAPARSLGTDFTKELLFEGGAAHAFLDLVGRAYLANSDRSLTDE